MHQSRGKKIPPHELEGAQVSYDHTGKERIGDGIAMTAKRCSRKSRVCTQLQTKEVEQVS